MDTPFMELIALGIRHIAEIPDLNRRADVLTAAARACANRDRPEQASALELAAADLRKADQAQLRLNEQFSSFTSF